MPGIRSRYLRTFLDLCCDVLYVISVALPYFLRASSRYRTKFAVLNVS